MSGVRGQERRAAVVTPINRVTTMGQLLVLFFLRFTKKMFCVNARLYRMMRHGRLNPRDRVILANEEAPIWAVWLSTKVDQPGRYHSFRNQRRKPTGSECKYFARSCTRLCAPDGAECTPRRRAGCAPQDTPGASQDAPGARRKARRFARRKTCRLHAARRAGCTPEDVPVARRKMCRERAVCAPCARRANA